MESRMTSNTLCELAEHLEFEDLKISDYGIGNEPDHTLRARGAFGV